MQPIKTIILIIAISLSTFTVAGSGDNIKSSLLLLIDSSGSMGDRIGNGNPEVKIEAARAAAIEAVNKATQLGLVEVAVLAFEGGCSNPIAKHLDFTTDENKLINFINQIQPAGGTPMADAVLKANAFMQNHGKPNALTQMIVLLADGQNDCGDVKQAMATLQASGAIFRHETVGFGIAPNSSASADLRYIANASGGTYHHAQNAVQLGDAFDNILDTFTVIDLIGQFTQHSLSGKNQAQPQKPKSNKKPSINLNLLDNILTN